MPSHTEQAVLDKHRHSSTQRRRNRLATLLKWVGGATAILSLIFALQQVTQLVAGVRERQRNITELYKVGKLQQVAADYEAAWASFQQAATIADSGGQLATLTGRLGERRRELRAAQEDLAMEWLENVVVSEGHTFAEVVDRLVPILTRGAASASRIRKADILAHIGWAYFLRSRYDVRQDLEQQYRQALEIDPANPYAHAHWGHWRLWSSGDLDASLRDAREHFSAALASGRARLYVRRIQLAALGNVKSERVDGELLQAVNDMVRNNEKTDARTRGDVYAIYWFALRRGEGFQRLIEAVPATEHIAMIRALFYDPDFDPSKIPSRETFLATFQEAAGLRDEALKTWLAMRSGLSAGSDYDTTRVDAAIKRLSKK